MPVDNPQASDSLDQKSKGPLNPCVKCVLKFCKKGSSICSKRKRFLRYAKKQKIDIKAEDFLLGVK